jgi:hypothetical protein
MHRTLPISARSQTAHRVVVTGQHLAGASAPRLHLVRDEQRAVPVQQLLRLLQVALVWHDNACLALHQSMSENWCHLEPGESVSNAAMCNCMSAAEHAQHHACF